MYHEIKGFISRSLIITLLVAVTGLLVFRLLLKEYYLSIFPLLLGFFCVLNIVVHSLLVYASEKKSLKFETAYMISFFVKFFGYILFTLLYIKNHRENFKIFIAVLFTLYVIYTSFEIKSIISYLKRSSNNYKKSN
jgi:hypothetical protein